MTTDYRRDPEPDAELGLLLRAAAGPAPEVDWPRLERKIVDAGRLPLAAARRARRRRSLAPLLRTLVPLAAAAGIGGAYLAVEQRRELPPAERALVEQMVSASLPESVDQLITGEAAQGALLEVIAGS